MDPQEIQKILIKVDQEVMEDVNTININEIVNNINELFRERLSKLSKDLTNEQLIKIINLFDKHIPCIPQVDEIISKLADLFPKIFNSIAIKYNLHLKNINITNIDLILTPNCEFELMKQIPCPFRQHFINQRLNTFTESEEVTIYNFDEDIIHLEIKFNYLMVQTSKIVRIFDYNQNRWIFRATSNNIVGSVDPTGKLLAVLFKDDKGVHLNIFDIINKQQVRKPCKFSENFIPNKLIWNDGKSLTFYGADNLGVIILDDQIRQYNFVRSDKVSFDNVININGLFFLADGNQLKVLIKNPKYFLLIKVLNKCGNVSELELVKTCDLYKNLPVVIRKQIDLKINTLIEEITIIDSILDF
jgi:hypothetical protein